MRAGSTFAGLAVLTLLMSGCHVREHKTGDSNGVNIDTPFGGLHVRTNQATVLEQIGLAPYPGAQVLKKHQDNGAADVNINFGSFRMQVKAANYHTSDAPEKVEAFYREELRRYGDVIQCRDNHPVGEPTRTFEGLTCEEHQHGYISVQDRTGTREYELKAGSSHHQHIVAITPNNGGTDLGLVMLDLPEEARAD